MYIFKDNESIEISNAAEFEAFVQSYHIIQAAGGIVRNENEEILMIQRLGKWDFPKGKVETGELYTETAIREVEEETGLRNITIEKALPCTYHTYMLNGTPIIKETHWFEMHALSQSLTPQTIEDITQAVWIERESVSEKMINSYPSLRWLWKEINNN